MEENPAPFAAYPRQADPRQYFGPPEFRMESVSEAWYILKGDYTTWIVSVLLIGIIAILVQSPATIMAMVGSFNAEGRVPPTSSATIIVSFVCGLLTVGVSSSLYGGLYRVIFERMRLRYEGIPGIFNAKGSGWTLFWWGVISGIPIQVVNVFYMMSIGSQTADLERNPFAMLGVVAVFLGALAVLGFLMFPFFLVPAIVVDKNLSLMEAAALSWKTVVPKYFKVLGIYIVISLVSGLGVFACGIGLLLTYPLYFLSVAVLYRDHFIPPIQISEGLTNFEQVRGTQ